jgi:dTDP-glucose 4,6-dehydratase
MTRSLTNIMVTGGAGFIGCNFIRYLFGQRDFAGRVINVDKLTYAGNLASVADIDNQYGGSRYYFEKVDICDTPQIQSLFSKYDIDAVAHFAAESHVDRSIAGPLGFVQSNVFGTFSMLEAARLHWKGRKDVLFHTISTDEVYGSLGESGYFTETTPYNPRSPYSASKAAADHFTSAYFHTYGLPVTLSNCSNNYGPYQNREKLIPMMITKMIDGQPLPVYGDGRNIRDWLYVEDHVAAAWLIMKNGRIGESYNIGGGNECENIHLVRRLCKLFAERTGRPVSVYEKSNQYVKDRPGHDRRYAISFEKIRKELGWTAQCGFEEGLKRTVDWYLKEYATES